MMAILSYANNATREIAENVSSKQARRLLPLTLHRTARKTIVTLANIKTLEDLKIFRGWKLEALKGDRKGQYSLRINIQYRICFSWDEQDIYNVEIIDYH